MACGRHAYTHGRANRAALIDVLVRISALVELVPELRELDLNPVIVHADGAVTVDARMRLRGTEL